MRVMVTGGSGFVGRNVVTALIARGVEVFSVGRSQPKGMAKSCSWVNCDLLNSAATKSALAVICPDIVIHLAWTVEHHAFWTSRLNLHWLAATLRLAELAADVGVTRFVGVGTCYEYDWPNDADCDEATTAIRPRNLYSISKDATRRVLEGLFHDRLSFAWARLFFLYGAGEAPNRLVASICRALAADEPAPCSRGLAVRDFMDARDAGTALAAVALSSFTGPINIAGGEAVSVAEVAGKLGQLAGRPDLVHLGALTDRVNEPPRITASGEVLRSATGFATSRSLDSGLADALRYWSARSVRDCRA